MLVIDFECQMSYHTTRIFLAGKLEKLKVNRLKNLGNGHVELSRFRSEKCGKATRQGQGGYQTIIIYFIADSATC